MTDITKRLSGLRSIRREKAARTSASSMVKPGTAARVESIIRASSPSAPISANMERSVFGPRSTLWSILKSPVNVAVAVSVFTWKAKACEMEWLAGAARTVKRPSFTRSPGAMTRMRGHWPGWVMTSSRLSRIYCAVSALQ